MPISAKPAVRGLLRGLATLLFALAGLLILVGGRAISEFAKLDRILSEFLGLVLAAGFAGLGLLAKSEAGPDDDSGPSAGRGTI